MVLLFLVLLAISASAQPSATLRGRVGHAADGQPLPGASIALPALSRGAVADEQGRYLIGALPPGAHVVEFSFVGFRTLRLQVHLQAGQSLEVDAALEGESIALGAITVTPGRFAIMGNEPSSRQTLTREEIQTIPQFGEDIFRSINRLPGVSGDDFSAKFTVRGGEHEQILVLVDGVELYDPFHLKDVGGGVLSIVDVGLVEGIDLLTGGFTAEYGDRLSAVFNIRSITPPPGRRRLGVGLSLMNGRALVEGGGERDSWLVSARRGYLDLVLALMGEEENFSPTYHDVFAKYARRLGDGQEVHAGLLRSQDDLDFVEDDEDVAKTAYGNTYAWIGLRSTLAPALLAQTALSAGRVDHRREGLAFLGNSRLEEFGVADRRDFDFLALRQDWSLEKERHFFKAGFDLRFMDAAYDYLSTKNHYRHLGQRLEIERTDTTALQRAPSARRLGFYLADRARLAGPLAGEFGLRYDRASHSGEAQWSPRLNLVLALGRRTWLRGGWGYFHQSQGIHELAVQDGERDFHPAERAEHRVLGLERFLTADLHLRLEAYEKRLSALRPSWRNWRNLIEIFPELQNDRVRVDRHKATSRGLELYLKKEGSRFSWWFSYALARVEEKVRGFAAEGQYFPSAATLPGPRDQRHTLYLDFNFRPSPRWSLNAAWQYRSGWPYTRPELRREVDARGQVGYYQVVDEIYGATYPAFHRLDLRLNRRFSVGPGHLSTFIELVNLYNYGNVRAYDFALFCPTGRCRLEEVPEYWFRLLPSIGLTWEGDF